VKIIGARLDQGLGEVSFEPSALPIMMA